MAITVFPRQNIPAVCQGIEVLVVEQVSLRHLKEMAVAGQCIGSEQILGKNIGLVVRRLLGAVGAAVVDVIGDKGNRGGDDPRQKRASLGDACQFGRVQQTGLVFVQDVAGPGGNAFGLANGWPSRSKQAAYPSSRRRALAAASASPELAERRESPEINCPMRWPGTKPSASYQPPISAPGAGKPALCR